MGCLYQRDGAATKAAARHTAAKHAFCCPCDLHALVELVARDFKVSIEAIVARVHELPEAHKVAAFQCRLGLLRSRNFRHHMPTK